MKWDEAEAAVNDLSVIDVKEILKASDMELTISDTDTQYNEPFAIERPFEHVEVTFDIEKFRHALCTKLTRI